MRRAGGLREGSVFPAGSSPGCQKTQPCLLEVFLSLIQKEIYIYIVILQVTKKPKHVSEMQNESSEGLTRTIEAEVIPFLGTLLRGEPPPTAPGPLLGESLP